MNAGENEERFRAILEEGGFKTIAIDGFAKAVLGSTNLDEVFRVTW
jgi:type II secretory ATPase GspE/PulE/Tfp pilus assembly ATPase PilB-like protein